MRWALIFAAAGCACAAAPATAPPAAPATTTPPPAPSKVEPAAENLDQVTDPPISSAPLAPTGPDQLDGPPDGLLLDVRAEPFRVSGGWGLRITLDAQVLSHDAFDLGSAPAPHLMGARRLADGTELEFGDGCWAGAARDTILSRGQKRRFVRRFGEDALDVIEPGQTLTLEVGLCRVGLPGGGWPDVPAATVVLQVPTSGKPSVQVTPR